MLNNRRLVRQQGDEGAGGDEGDEGEEPMPNAPFPIDISENECRDVAMQRLYKGFR
jgi:hypothetical protein